MNNDYNFFAIQNYARILHWKDGRIKDSINYCVLIYSLDLAIGHMGIVGVTIIKVLWYSVTIIPSIFVASARYKKS